MFEYSEEYDKEIMELNGIFFCCEEAEDGYEDEAKSLSKAYYDKLDDIAEFMLNERLSDFYGESIELDADIIKENLGTPMIDLDTHQIIYCEQTLDDIHVFEVEFGDDLDDLLYCSVDG